MSILSKTTTPPTLNAVGMVAEQVHKLANHIQAELLKDSPDAANLRTYLRQIASLTINTQAAI